MNGIPSKVALHSNTSATTEKNSQCRPQANGEGTVYKQVSIPHHIQQQAIWYALLISTLASTAPLPRQEISLAASSTFTYEREHQSLLIPSLTLWFWGDDKSKIRRHWPFFLGITPKGLTCAWGGKEGLMGPTRPPKGVLLQRAYCCVIFLYFASGNWNPPRNHLWYLNHILG